MDPAPQSPESNESEHQNIIPEQVGNSSTHALHRGDGKAITNKDGIGLVCFACYLEKSIQGTIDVLEIVREMISMNGDKANIEEGFDLVEFALDGLQEQLAAKPHGKGLPGDLVPVRGIPYVVTPKKEGQEAPAKEA